MNHEDGKKRERDQKLKPGVKSLTIKIPEDLHRRFRVRACELGITNDELFLRILGANEHFAEGGKSS